MPVAPRGISKVSAASGPYAADPRAFVAANMFLYYEQGNNRRHVSPDVFVSLNIPKDTDPPRESYFLWREGKGPDVVIELTSESTRDVDRDTKRTLYQDTLRVSEYFLFDPNDDYLDPPLQGFRLVSGVYQPIPSVNGRVPSEVLRLHLEADGEMLRLWDPATRRRLLIPPEVEAALRHEEQARLQAEQERNRAERQRMRSEEAHRQAEEARQREEEARRQAEAEVERLRRELEALRNKPPE